MSGVPDCWFDGLTHVVGGGSTTYYSYKAKIDQRLGVATPVTIRSRGSIGETSGWVTAVFKAEEQVNYNYLRAQFVLYEMIDEAHPWLARDMLPVESVTLSAPGDSAVVSKNFTVLPTWDPANMGLVVILENTSPRTIVNSQIMPDAYKFEFATDDNVVEIDFWGDAVFNTTIENTGSFADTVDLELLTDLPAEWDAVFCVGGLCYDHEAEIYLEPGQVESIPVHIYSADQPDLGTATLTGTMRSDPNKTATEYYAAFCALPSILVLDDDAGATHETYMETALDDAGYPGLVWDVNAMGWPSAAYLSSFWAIFWTTADGDGSYIGAEEEQAMADFLDGGGNLFFASMDYLSSRTMPSDFLYDYLHVAGWSSNTSGFTMQGVVGDPISDGMSLGVLGGPFPPSNSDSMHMSAPADTMFTAATGNKGLRVEEDGHKVAFIAFPFECVKVGDPDPNNQKTIVSRAVNWFGPPTSVEGESALPVHRLVLRQNHPNPFNPTTAISFAVPNGSGDVEVKVYDVTGRMVKSLVSEPLPAGEHTVVWNGKDEAGRTVASGIYFCRLSVEGESAARKMVLMK